MSVTLRERKNSTGTVSLFLDIKNKGERKYEFLHHLRLERGTDPATRQRNKERKEQANKITAKRAHQLSASDYNMKTDDGKKTIVVEWMESYIKKYKKKDKRNMEGALARFKDFLKEEKKQAITFSQIDEHLIKDFRDYLQTKSIGEGGRSYFARFKKMMKVACTGSNRLIDYNPAADIKNTGTKARPKDALTSDEIRKVYHTPTKAPEIKKAFLFCCMAGPAWCDVIRLRWSNIKDRTLSYDRQKGKGQYETVSVYLNDFAMKLIGERGDSDQPLFDFTAKFKLKNKSGLITADGANKTIKNIVKRAGIDKNITWHCARHSLGTNAAMNEAQLLTIASMLGHSTTRTTERYAKAAEILKNKASQSINIEI